MTVEKLKLNANFNQENFIISVNKSLKIDLLIKEILEMYNWLFIVNKHQRQSNKNHSLKGRFSLKNKHGSLIPECYTVQDCFSDGDYVFCEQENKDSLIFNNLPEIKPIETTLETETIPEIPSPQAESLIDESSHDEIKESQQLNLLESDLESEVGEMEQETRQGEASKEVVDAVSASAESEVETPVEAEAVVVSDSSSESEVEPTISRQSLSSIKPEKMAQMVKRPRKESSSSDDSLSSDSSEDKPISKKTPQRKSNPLKKLHQSAEKRSRK